MFEIGIISAPIQILETPTTLLLLSPRHLQFFNNKKSSVISLESTVFKALICSQYVFAASRSHVVKIDMTDVSSMSTYAYDIDITNIALFKSHLVVVQDMFVNIQGRQEECFDYSVVAVDATDNFLFVLLGDGSLYRYASSFDYLRKIKNAFDVKAGDMLFVANSKNKVDVLDLDGRLIKRVKAPGIVLKIIQGDFHRQDTSSADDTAHVPGPSLAVLIGLNGAREVVFYNSEYTVTSRLGCLDCFSSGYNIYVRMSHSEYDMLYLGKLKPFIRKIDKVYRHEYYTIGTSGKNMYLLRNETILNNVELEDEIVEVVFAKKCCNNVPGSCEAKTEHTPTFVVLSKSIVKIADLPSLGLVHVMGFEFLYGICAFSVVISVNQQVLVFDLTTEEVIEKINEEFIQEAESTVQDQSRQKIEGEDDGSGTKTQCVSEKQCSQMKNGRVHRKIVFSKGFYKLRNDGVLIVGDHNFSRVCDFMVADEKLFLLSKDDVRIYRIESREDDHARSPSEVVCKGEDADAKEPSRECAISSEEESVAIEYTNNDGDEMQDKITENNSMQSTKNVHNKDTLKQSRMFNIVASMPVHYNEYAFGACALFLSSKTSVTAIGNNVVHRQESAENVYTYNFGDGFVVLKKGSRFCIYEESQFIRGEATRMRTVNLSHDDFNFKAFVEREKMLENLESGIDRLSVRAEDYANAARRVRDKIRKKKYWFF
eukprot:jgi/Antlo1/217/1499